MKKVIVGVVVLMLWVCMLQPNAEAQRKHPLKGRWVGVFINPDGTATGVKGRIKPNGKLILKRFTGKPCGTKKIIVGRLSSLDTSGDFCMTNGTAMAESCVLVSIFLCGGVDTTLNHIIGFWQFPGGAIGDFDLFKRRRRR